MKSEEDTLQPLLPTETVAKKSKYSQSLPEKRRNLDPSEFSFAFQSERPLSSKQSVISFSKSPYVMQNGEGGSTQQVIQVMSQFV